MSGPRPPPAHRGVANAAWSGAAPALSVLMPFFHDDPRALLSAIDRQASAAGVVVELVALDDGSGDDALADGVEDLVCRLRSPAALVRLIANQGRAVARNQLARRARAPFLLFLDADVTPADERFLAAYLEAAAEPGAAVVIGGFTVPASAARGRRLHHHMASRYDCMPAPVRQAAAWKYAFSSNLLVRRDVAAAVPFDETFAGWGWEDFDWGMRVAEHWPIRHIDNNVVHEGLETDAAFVAKIAGSGGNFARAAAGNPRLIRTFACHRAASLLRRLPARGLGRALTKRLALAAFAPMAARAMALRVYRALVYAEVVDVPSAARAPGRP